MLAVTFTFKVIAQLPDGSPNCCIFFPLCLKHAGGKRKGDQWWDLIDQLYKWVSEPHQWARWIFHTPSSACALQTHDHFLSPSVKEIGSNDPLLIDAFQVFEAHWKSNWSQRRRARFDLPGCWCRPTRRSKMAVQNTVHRQNVFQNFPVSFLWNVKLKNWCPFLRLVVHRQNLKIVFFLFRILRNVQFPKIYDALLKPN